MKSVLMNGQRLACVASVFLTANLGAALSAHAQDFSDLQVAKSPLVLRAQGSFFQGGASETLDDGSHITINQMYVQYSIPQGGTDVPVVMVHGGGLSGKSYETTPDGRMGWAEYFVRKGYPVFVPDQVSRGRSSFDPTDINKVRAGKLPPSALPSISRTTDESAWVGFRLGPKPGVPFPGTQFPVKYAGDLSKQGVPLLNAQDPHNYQALSDLARELKGAVLLGHSESGRYPIEAALVNSAGIKGMIMLEPTCKRINLTTGQISPLSDKEVAKLVAVPLLVVFGDHLEAPRFLGRTYQTDFDDCTGLIARINKVGGKGVMLHLPALGIRGNTHMMMNDKNSNQIADLIMKWIYVMVDKKKPWQDVAQR